MSLWRQISRGLRALKGRAQAADAIDEERARADLVRQGLSSEEASRAVRRELGDTLVLSALGLYGILAGRVAERTREIGLRSAFGATPEQILALVVRQGMTLAGLGVAIGLAGAAAATQGLESLLYGVTSLDPLTYGGVVALMAAVAAAACWLPAARAARVDPTIALRAE